MSDKRAAVAIGQLRRWGVLPIPSWATPHPANGKTFRIDRLENASGYVHALYEPWDPAIFTSAKRDFIEEHSVIVEEAATPSKDSLPLEGGKR